MKNCINTHFDKKYLSCLLIWLYHLYHWNNSWFIIKLEIPFCQNKDNIVLFSSNINEGIRAVLFFKRKDFTRTKSTKTYISEQKQKRQRFYELKKHLRGKMSLIHLFAFLWFLCAFCAFLCVTQKRQHFHAHKNHLRGRKSLVWPFMLFVLSVLFMLFMHIKNI